ncbi:MAG: hypothetical protein A2233_05490 [Candidatus Kerfeldbacteria bacterium RIFOXYA2_FULL_38_24]|uniref:ABC transporter domain-containing protein n=1 Tax=Candidatus Kerfeldbacteria bacterium RIFOXYB2_FULL_38_14 TaxID=1798547 RepID=A0A1G2BJ04_9BACT|nr:MAG: hypothetical protein A2233_05490 [Candidatus Kerfeldbacteria bacterium RIFOXYA2_FULL_38_24]OGY88280.1 MAG: hypothetical protein A2319_03775 [Candidatus Kerfeldbacteria bacterium RIFOXYB2_FULL_38_14]
MENIIKVENLKKVYDRFVAVDQVSFEVKKGEIFGILGPNGAGKTTTLEMIEGLKTVTSGDAIISGISVKEHPARVKKIIGVQLQSSAFFDYMNLRELIDFFGKIYGVAVDAKKLLADVSLTDKWKNQAKELSGGQRQRLSIAVAMANNPTVVFLDEPTTGLDPQARRHLWDLIRGIQAKGKTVVLTTHYMEEAEVLCDRIAIMDAAKVVALDTPVGLLRRVEQRATITFRTKALVDLSTLEKIPGVLKISQAKERVELSTHKVEEALPALLAYAKNQNLDFTDLQVREVNLEDVFLKLTGKQLRD